MLEVQTLKLTMGEMFTPDASEVEEEEEDDSGKGGTSSNFFVRTGGHRHYDKIPGSLMSLIKQQLSSAVFRTRCTGFSTW
jgi:hypothetical protein